MPQPFLTKSKVPTSSLGVPNMQVKLFGDWEKAVVAIQKMGPAVKEAGLKSQMRIANMIVTRVKAHIKNQDLHWKPLSHSYAEKKEREGLNEWTMFAYGNYYRAIKAWTVGSQNMVLIGVRRGLQTQSLSGRKSKMEIANIAVVHEFSSGRRIPKRPLWNPTIAELGGAKGLKALFVKHLVSHLRVRGIPVKQYSTLKL